jgi:NADH-quinone oxidoreductase subunit I
MEGDDSIEFSKSGGYGGYLEIHIRRWEQSMSYWKEIFDGGWSLVEGMRVTIRRLFKPVVTLQYPRRVLTMSPAYRGHIEFIRFPETGTHGCIACGTCHLIDYTRCSLCGLCVECCPTQTLKYSTEFSLEGPSRWSGVIDLMQRLEENKS